MFLAMFLLNLIQLRQQLDQVFLLPPIFYGCINHVIDPELLGVSHELSVRKSWHLASVAHASKCRLL
jgi:hypothetical protein